MRILFPDDALVLQADGVNRDSAWHSPNLGPCHSDTEPCITEILALFRRVWLASPRFTWL